MASWQDYLGLLGYGQGGNGILGQVDLSSVQNAVPSVGPVTPPANDGDFWSTKNPDGTTSILGGLFKYDPSKDIGRGDRLGLFGATLKDAGADLGGNPEAATNLARFSADYKKQLGQSLLMRALNGAPPGSPTPSPPSGTGPAMNAAPLASSGLGSSTSWNANNPGPTSGPMTVPPGSDHPNAPPPTPQSSLPQVPFSIRPMLPKLAQAAAMGVDVAPIVSLLKDAAPKFNTTVNYSKDGRAYLIGDDGSVDWLEPGVTPRDKIEIAGNGTAYNPYVTAPGTDFSDRSKPFDSTSGAPNKPVQTFEMDKVKAGRNPPGNTGWAVVNDPTTGQPYRYNANTAQATDMSGKPIQAGGYGKISASNDFGLSPTQQAAINQAVAAGNLDITRLTRGNAKTIADTLVANPKADLINLHAFGQNMTNAQLQKSAQSVARIPEMLRMVSDSGKALNYDDNRFIGAIQKWKNGTFNDPAFVRYMTQRNDALLSMAGAFRGTGATDMATKLEDEASAPTMSPRAMDAWMRANNDMLQPTLDYYKNFAITNPRTQKPVNTQGTINTPPRTFPGPTALPRLPTKAGTSGGVKWRILPAGSR